MNRSETRTAVSSFFPRIHIPGRFRRLFRHDGLPRVQFPRLSRTPGFKHAYFTRAGGSSGGPYRSLNTSFSVGDRPEDVRENLRRIRAFMGARRLVFMNQRHGTDIVVLRKETPGPGEAVPEADAVITDAPGVAVMVKQADCQGVLLMDPEKGVLAGVHCGWRGNTQNILAKVVDRMGALFGTSPACLVAAIGPSLGPCCAEFRDHAEMFPESFRRFMVGDNRFDLWALSCAQLCDAGLSMEQIEVAGMCTRCHPDLFYSYRGEGLTGRFAAAAMIL